MPAFACYALKSELNGVPVQLLSDFLIDNAVATVYGPTASPDFEVQLWVTEALPRPPRWGGFLQDGFPEIGIPLTSSTSALLVVRVEASPSHYFALAFGPAGRHLLRDEAPIRGFGLKVALKNRRTDLRQIPRDEADTSLALGLVAKKGDKMSEDAPSARREAADYYGVSEDEVTPVPVAPLCTGMEGVFPCMRLQGHKGPHRSRAYIDRSPYPLKWDVRGLDAWDVRGLDA